MAARSADTDPAAERVQIELLRKAGPSHRARMAFSLSADVITFARQALRRAEPDATEEELALRFVERHYGRELASGLRARLRNRVR